MFLTKQVSREWGRRAFLDEEGRHVELKRVRHLIEPALEPQQLRLQKGALPICAVDSRMHEQN